MVICVLCVVLFAVAYFSYIEHKYSDGSNITKFLVGSSGSVLDDNDHINDIYIESEQQIEIISVFYQKFNETLYLIFDYPYKYYTFKHFEV